MINQPTGPTLLGFDVLLVGTILAGVAALAIMMAIYAAITVRDPMAKRVKALTERREELKQGIVKSSSKKRTSLVRKSDKTEKMKDTLAGMKVLQQSQIQDVQQKLAHAGYRNRELAVYVIALRMVMPIILGAIGFLVIYVIDYFPDWGGMKRVAGMGAMLYGGYKGPEMFLQNKSNKRVDAIRKGLPDALDLLVICDEFALTAIELSFLNERKMAFDNLAYRVNLDAVKGVVTTMVQTERYGTPLASALRVLSAEFRNERMMRAEEKAARLPAIMTVPLILFILPVLFIVILGPAACSIADVFSDDGPTKKG